MRMYVWGVVYLWVVNMLDVFYTKTIVESGLTTEANPMAGWVISTYGFTGLAIVKTFWIFALLVGLFSLYNKEGKITDTMAMLFWGTLVAYTALMGYHIALRTLMG